MKTGKEALDSFIEKFDPAIAELARSAVSKLNGRYPYASQLVYDNYNALAIGFGPSDRASEAIFSIAVYPRRVLLCFLQGGKSDLKDPHQLLEGSGTTNRFIPLASVAALDDPRVRDLMEQAIRQARTPFDPQARGQLIIKSVSEKQRPRRPGGTKVTKVSAK